jgi:hypothetical protein
MLNDKPTLCPFCAEPITEASSAGTMLTWRGLSDIDDIPSAYTGSNFHVSCLDQAVHEQFSGMLLLRERDRRGPAV